MVAITPIRYLTGFLLVFISFLSNAQSDRSYIQLQLKGLKESLKHYQQISESDWYFFACDSCLNPGEKSNLITLLRSNLLLSGDLKKQDNISTIEYDTMLVAAVKKFQQRNGLEADGIIGSKTIDALNVPISFRVNQIRINISKWDSLNQLVTEPFILVNVPDFSLKIIDNSNVSYQMKVVVGRTTHPTPELISQIEQIVLHPSWNVPYNISVKEILPILKEDKSYLTRNHMRVFTYDKKKKITVNADTINWQNISEKKFQYLFEQVPGNWNALGKIKFIFPNAYQVYLHDTPEKYLFNHPKRTYSHGCVRLERPMELADWLVKNSEDIDKNTLSDYLKNNSATKIVNLTKPVQVSLSYFTAWIGEDGILQFRDNIYNQEETYFLNQDIIN